MIFLLHPDFWQSSGETVLWVFSHNYMINIEKNMEIFTCEYFSFEKHFFKEYKNNDK